MTDVEAGDGISVSSFLPIFRRCAVHHPFESLCEFPGVVVAHHPADLRNAQRLPLHEQLRRQIHAVICQPCADGRAVDRPEGLLHRRQRNAEAGGERFLREMLRHVLGQEAPDGLDLFDLRPMEIGRRGLVRGDGHRVQTEQQLQDLDLEIGDADLRGDAVQLAEEVFQRVCAVEHPRTGAQRPAGNDRLRRYGEILERLRQSAAGDVAVEGDGQAVVMVGREAECPRVPQAQVQLYVAGLAAELPDGAAAALREQDRPCVSNRVSAICANASFVVRMSISHC